jgi:hypothetical protein
LFLITAFFQQTLLADEGHRIGAVLGLTGPASIIGQEIHQGMHLCADPGTNLIIEDSQGLPASGLSAFKKLVEQDRVNVSVVTFRGVAGAVLSIAAVKQIPVVLNLKMCFLLHLIFTGWRLQTNATLRLNFPGNMARSLGLLSSRLRFNRPN